MPQPAVKEDSSLGTHQQREERIHPKSLPLRKPSASVCAQCGANGDMIEPLFDLDMSSSRIPMRCGSLKTYLSKLREQYPHIKFLPRPPEDADADGPRDQGDSGGGVSEAQADCSGKSSKTGLFSWRQPALDSRWISRCWHAPTILPCLLFSLSCC